MAIAQPGTASERSVSHDARILVVDDESDIANLLGTVLREEGFTVRVVTDSRQALEVFNSFRPDLVSLVAGPGAFIPGLRVGLGIAAAAFLLGALLTAFAVERRAAF